MKKHGVIVLKHEDTGIDGKKLRKGNAFASMLHQAYLITLLQKQAAS